ncbi:MAG: 5-(carboxyamino)imidazole ribonucleotide mutase [Acidimicrobiia bacterium]|nr:5-(carboxyamino)imidazole ribonucleotide mutase [Acidimicrobiia bacterium]
MAAGSDPGSEPDPPEGVRSRARPGALAGAGRGTGSALVGVVMGSDSDWATMRRCSEVLGDFDVAHECRVVSAHRTPDLLTEYARLAEDRGLQVIVAGAGGAAHLPGMLAAQTIVPVIGVPVASRALNGMDSLLSIVQMPAGVPVATMAIGEAGAANAGLLAVAMLARHDPDLADRLTAYRATRAAQVRATQLER